MTHHHPVDNDLSNDDAYTDDDAWRAGYPYPAKMTQATYERKKRQLQVELLKLQAWTKETGERIIILFEGRDAAGKGSTINRFMEHLNPRGAHVVALEKPTARERTQWHFQRYVEHLPAAGEIVLFDRSWYNRAGVERVMEYCTPREYLDFMRATPDFERMLTNSGIRLIKFWFSVGREEQRRRFARRAEDAVQTMEALPDRPGLRRQVGRVHERERSDAVLHGHRSGAVDGHQVE